MFWPTLQTCDLCYICQGPVSPAPCCGRQRCDLPHPEVGGAAAAAAGEASVRGALPQLS